MNCRIELKNKEYEEKKKIIEHQAYQELTFSPHINHKSRIIASRSKMRIKDLG